MSDHGAGRDSRGDDLTVALLGTGIMGLPMARRMAEAGLRVRVWNRTPERAAPLTEHGIQIFGTPAETARGANVLVTMLADADAVLDAVSADTGALDALPDDAVWAQMSTIGIGGIARCQEVAGRRGIGLVDAPVLGTKQPAEQGELVILASGPEDAVAACRPVFEAVGKNTAELGEVGAGTRLKLVVNHWVLAVVEGVAETTALAEALDVDPRRFLKLIAGGPLDSPYAQTKTTAILDRQLEPSFSLKLARKDAGLVLEAAQGRGHDAALARLVAQRMQRAIERGHGDEDIAATYFGCVDRDQRNGTDSAPAG